MLNILFFYLLSGLTMSVFGNTFRSSNLKNTISIIFDSVDRSEGANENLQISLNEEITRVRKFIVSDASIPITYYAVNQGNIMITIRAKILNGGTDSISLHIPPGKYTADDLVDTVRELLSEYRILASFNYDDELDTFYFELNNYETTSNVISVYGELIATSISSLQSQLNYEKTSTAIASIGFNTDINIEAVTRNRLYAKIPINWDMRFEERNDKPPFMFLSTFGVSVPSNTYMVHDIADLMQTQLNALGVGEYIFKFNNVLSVFVLKMDRLFVFDDDSADNDNIAFGFPNPTPSSTQQWTHSFIGDQVDLIEQLLTFNSLSFTIKERSIVTINIPDLNNNTLEEAVEILQIAIDSSSLVNTYMVSIDNQNNVFTLRSDKLFTIVSFSTNFGNSYGLILTERESTIIYGEVPWYPSFEYNVVNANSIEFVTTQQQFVMDSATYTHSSFTTKLAAGLNVDMPVATWTITYDDDTNKITVDEDSGSIFIVPSVESIYKQLGNTLDGTTVSSFPIMFINMSIMDSDKYILIKSFDLTRNKENNFYVKEVFSEAVGKILIKNDFKNTENIYLRGIFQTIFPLNIAYKDIDFRLEFSSGRLVNLNGQDWSLTIIFATY